MTVEEFKALVRKKDNAEICHEVLFSSDIWLAAHKSLGPSSAVYDSMKRFFGSKLKIQPSNVAIVGSAKTGFSLNPSKKFKAFHDEDSDIDVILVSPQKFAEFWTDMLSAFYNRSSSVTATTHKDVFRKFVTLRRSDSWPSDSLQTWHRTMDAVKQGFFTEFSVSNPIKYRIYESWDAAQSYHESGVAALRKQIGGA